VAARTPVAPSPPRSTHGRSADCAPAGPPLDGVLAGSLIFLSSSLPAEMRNQRVFGPTVFLQVQIRPPNALWGKWSRCRRHADYLHSRTRRCRRFTDTSNGEWLMSGREETKRFLAWIKANTGRLAVISLRKLFTMYGVPRDLRTAWLEPLEKLIVAASSAAEHYLACCWARAKDARTACFLLALLL